MAVCLLVLGNLWLVASLVLVLGRHLVRMEPTMYSFTQSGDWFYPDTYNTWIALCLTVAASYFVLSYLAWRRHA